MIALLLRYVHAMLPGVVLAALAFAAAWAPRRRRLTGRGLVSPLGREAVLLLFWLYSGAMAMVLLLPADFDLINVLREGYKGPFFRNGSVSLQFLRTTHFSRQVFWANVLAFVPFGFCPALLWREGRWYKALIAAFAIPAVVENWQLLVGRTFDVDDFLLNFAGVMLGFVLWRFLDRPTLHCEEE